LISGITTFCFAASYAVALALEATRLWFRSGVRSAVMLGFAGAGLLAHTLYLYQRASEAHETPLSSSYDWHLLAAWLLVGIYLYLTYYHPRAAIGLFLLPLVLALIGAAQLASREPLDTAPAARIWGIVHAAFLLLGTVSVIVGFVAGAMYLIQAHRLKKKLPPPARLRLPSLEWLQGVNERALVISVLMIGFGVLAGAVLNAVQHRQLPWSDPTVWSSAAMFGWLLAAALFSGFYKPARQGRKVAYLTVVSFLFLVISLSVLLLVDTEHGSGTGTGGRRSRISSAPLTVRALRDRRLSPAVVHWAISLS